MPFCSKKVSRRDHLDLDVVHHLEMSVGMPLCTHAVFAAASKLCSDEQSS